MGKIIFNKDKIIKYFSCGVESDVYLYENSETLLKLFKNRTPDGKLILNDELLKNKEKKLELLQNSNVDIEIYDLVYSNDKFIGYTMKKYDYNQLDYLDRKKDKIKYLKILRDKIEELNKQDIHIGDMNLTNVLVSKDKKDLKICDIDNLKVGNIYYDVMSRYMVDYIKSDADINNIDSYCFNIITLSYLNNIAFGYFYVYDLYLPRCLRTKENTEILQDMVRLDKNYQKRYLIDHLK